MTTIDRQAVTDCLSRLVTPGIKLTALADELGARKHEYAALRDILDDLVDDGTAKLLPGGAYALAPAGRAADPHAKPKKPPRPTPTVAPRTKRVTLPPPPPRKAKLPWSPPPAPPKPREVYDPETGETYVESTPAKPPIAKPRSGRSTTPPPVTPPAKVDDDLIK